MIHEVFVPYTGLLSMHANQLDWLVNRGIKVDWMTVETDLHFPCHAVFYFNNQKDAMFFRLVWG